MDRKPYSPPRVLEERRIQPMGLVPATAALLDAVARPLEKLPGVFPAKVAKACRRGGKVLHDTTDDVHQVVELGTVLFEAGQRLSKAVRKG